jgi:Uma2 family endonuclease
MAIVTRTGISLEAYLAYDDGTDTRYELENGELLALPPESRLNVQIASFLFAYFLRLGLPCDRLVMKTQIAVSGSLASAREPDLSSSLKQLLWHLKEPVNP